MVSIAELGYKYSGSRYICVAVGTSWNVEQAKDWSHIILNKGEQRIKQRFDWFFSHLEWINETINWEVKSLADPPQFIDCLKQLNVYYMIIPL